MVRSLPPPPFSDSLARTLTLAPPHINSNALHSPRRHSPRRMRPLVLLLNSPLLPPPLPLSPSASPPLYRTSLPHACASPESLRIALHTNTHTHISPPTHTSHRCAHSTPRRPTTPTTTCPTSSTKSAATATPLIRTAPTTRGCPCRRAPRRKRKGRSVLRARMPTLMPPPRWAAAARRTRMRSGVRRRGSSRSRKP